LQGRKSKHAQITETKNIFKPFLVENKIQILYSVSYAVFNNICCCNFQSYKIQSNDYNPQFSQQFSYDHICVSIYIYIYIYWLNSVVDKKISIKASKWGYSRFKFRPLHVAMSGYVRVSVVSDMELDSQTIKQTKIVLTPFPIGSTLTTSVHNKHVTKVVNIKIERA